MREKIQKFDDRYLFGVLYKLYLKYQYLDYLWNLKSSNNFNINLNYQKNKKSLLSSLCDKYGSDKGSLVASGHVYPWAPHTYADLYSLMFDHCRFGVRKVFECGIGTNQPDLASSMGVKGKPGASLRAWQEYFPNATIIGVDIDTSILFTEERIKTLYVDQTKPDSINKLWSVLGMSDFDIMIDDGLHTFESSITFFENSVQQLSLNGVYAIEDVSLSDLARYKEYFKNRDTYVVDYISLFRPNRKLANNNIVLIRLPQIVN